MSLIPPVFFAPAAAALLLDYIFKLIINIIIMELQDAVDQLHLVHARLLFVVQDMFVSGRLTSQEKIQLKSKQRYLRVEIIHSLA
jgi:hypothetical protein